MERALPSRSRMLADDHNLPVIGGLLRLLPERLLAGLGMPTSLALAGYTGVLLGTTSIPVWHKSPLLGALFMSSSFSTGIAATNSWGLINGAEDEEEEGEMAILAWRQGITEAVYLRDMSLQPERPQHHFSRRVQAYCWPAQSRRWPPLLCSKPPAWWPEVPTEDHQPAGKRDSPGKRRDAAVGRGARRTCLRTDREGTIEAMKPRKGSPGWRPTNV